MMRKKNCKCKSDLSKNPSTVAGMGDLPCEITGKHDRDSEGLDIHYRGSPPFQGYWVDLPDGGRKLSSIKPFTWDMS
jgi:hypothetical protein